MSQQKEIHCHACNARIIFNPLVKSASGKMIPLEYLTPDKKHDCPARKQQQNAIASSMSDRDKAIKTMHEETLQATKEQTGALLALTAEMAMIRQYLEVLAKDSTTKNAFRTASMEARS